MNVAVAILAGGLATRLRPITETIPKALVQVRGRPFLAYQLKLLADQGFSDVVICTGYKGEMIEAEVGNGNAFGLHVTYSHDGETLLGTGGALKKALPLLGDRFVVIYGDSYLVTDYKRLVSKFDEERNSEIPPPAGLMTVFRNEGQFDKSNVVFRDGRIVVYDKKNTHPEMHYIDWGLGILHIEAFEPFTGRSVFDLADLYSTWVGRGRLAGAEVAQRFYEIGSVAGIKDFEEYLALASQQP